MSVIVEFMDEEFAKLQHRKIWRWGLGEDHLVYYNAHSDSDPWSCWWPIGGAALDLTLEQMQIIVNMFERYIKLKAFW
jgi:hypothetical protein